MNAGKVTERNLNARLWLSCLSRVAKRRQTSIFASEHAADAEPAAKAAVEEPTAKPGRLAVTADGKVLQKELTTT